MGVTTDTPTTTRGMTNTSSPNALQIQADARLSILRVRIILGTYHALPVENPTVSHRGIRIKVINAIAALMQRKDSVHDTV